MNVLVIDIGGTHVKVLATGQKAEREFAEGIRNFAVDISKLEKSILRKIDNSNVISRFPLFVWETWSKPSSARSRFSREAAKEGKCLLEWSAWRPNIERGGERWVWQIA